MNKSKDNIKKLIFAVTFILSCFTMNSDHLIGYWGSKSSVYILARFGMIIFFVFTASIINAKNIGFISKFVPSAILIITALLIFDYYATNISGSQFLFRAWWIAYIFTAEVTFFLAISIYKTPEYKTLYYNFWYGFTPLYVFTIIICFLRAPFTARTINAIPFQGTFLMLKAFIHNPHISFEAPLIFFGNLFIFAPLPFVISAILKKIKPLQLAAIGLLAPIFVEGYQYVFQCGDVDIDDLILNWFGFLIGFILQQIIKKHRLVTD